MKQYPYITDRKMTADKAAQFMHDSNIHYLPVVENEELVGVVDEIKTRVAKFFHGSKTLVVEDIMDLNPCCIDESASLPRVIRAMLQSKHQYVLAINQNDKIVGIFTTTNALGILLEFLEEKENSSSLRIHYDKFSNDLEWRKHE